MPSSDQTQGFWNSHVYTPLKNQADKPWYGMTVAGIGFLIATFGSIHSSDIKDAFPLCCWAGLDFPWEPMKWTLTKDPLIYAFWFSALFWLYLFKVQEAAKGDAIEKLRAGVINVGQDVQTIQKAAIDLQEQSTGLIAAVSTVGDRTREIGVATGEVWSNVEATKEDAKVLLSTIEETKETIEEINYAVQTLPVKAFRTEFARKSTLIYTLAATAFPREISETEKDVAATIRSMLTQLVILRRTYEDNSDSRYAANVMLFLKTSNDPPYLTEDIMKKVRIFAPDTSVTAPQLLGALVLRKELSTSTSDLGKEDENVTEIALGIPVSAASSSAWFLPGASEIYAKSLEGGHGAPELISGFHDTNEWEKLLERGYHIPPETLESFRKYFRGTGRFVRSFVSLPLRLPNERLFGVLNIHSDSPYKFGEDRERQANFALIVTPLINEVAEVCNLLNKKRKTVQE